jgi:hypothetical protein
MQAKLGWPNDAARRIDRHAGMKGLVKLGHKLPEMRCHETSSQNVIFQAICLGIVGMRSVSIWEVMQLVYSSLLPGQSRGRHGATGSMKKERPALSADFQVQQRRNSWHSLIVYGQPNIYFLSDLIRPLALVWETGSGRGNVEPRPILLRLLTLILGWSWKRGLWTQSSPEPRHMAGG